MVEKIRPDKIDAIICAEYYDPETDPELYEVVKTNMIHGPCGDYNWESPPCMIENKCTKCYTRALLADTITGNNSYPLYHNRSAMDNSRTITLKVKNKDVVVDNSWIVFRIRRCFPKNSKRIAMLSSVKSSKYVCKYVMKGSDMTVFGIAAPNANDEVSQYQMGRYVSSNEVVSRIFSFSIHERHSTVVHLVVHLENE